MEMPVAKSIRSFQREAHADAADVRGGLRSQEVVIEPADSGLPKRSAVIVNQIRSVDRMRLQKKIGRLSRQNMERVDEAIKISLGLIEF